MGEVPLYERCTGIWTSQLGRPGKAHLLARKGQISQKVLIKSFCKSQLPHKSDNLSFSITSIENELTIL